MGSSEALMLDNLSKQGGGGFVALVRLAESGDKCAAEEIHDMAWEQLHSGPWHAVDAVWRDAYSLSSLLISACFEREGRLEKALKYLDMGLIMGGLLFRTRLETAIASIQSSLIISNNVSHSGGHGQGMCTAAREMDSDVETGCAEKGGLILPDEPSKTRDAAKASSPGKRLMKRKDPPDQRERLDGLVLKDFSILKDVDGAARLKSVSYAEVLKSLPPGSLCQAGIDERWLPSLETFARDFFIPGIPVVIKNGMSHWPAMTKWKDLNYLLKVAGNRTVPVEIGEHYLAPGWKQELMTIGELLERSRASDATSATRPYLAQHALFDQDGRFLS